MFLPVPGFEPTSSVFLGECVTHSATVADALHCLSENFIKPVSLMNELIRICSPSSVASCRNKI